MGSRLEHFLVFAKFFKRKYLIKDSMYSVITRILAIKMYYKLTRFTRILQVGMLKICKVMTDKDQTFC